MSRIASLRACLEAEIDATSAFIDLLEQEAELLTDSTALDTLPELTVRKQALADQLTTLARARLAHLPAVDQTNDTDTDYDRTTAVAATDDALWQAWHTLLDLADQAHDLSLRNGALIDVHLRHTQQSLAALRAAIGAGSLYAADGKPRPMGYKANRSVTIGLG